MNRIRSVILISVIAAVLIVVHEGVSHATGFGRYEIGARGMGAGGTAIATAEDPSMVYHNPAGLGALKGAQLYGGASLLLSKTSVAGVGPFPGFGVRETWADELVPLPHGFAALQLGPLVGGVGIYTPYRYRAEWSRPDFFSGRYISTSTDISGTYVTAAAALNFFGVLRVGAGTSVVVADAEIVRRLPATTIDGASADVIDLAEARYTGSSGLGETVHAGAQLDVGPIAIGAVARLGVKNEMDGRVTYRFLASGDAAADSARVNEVPEDRDISIAFQFPTELGAGISIDLTSKWRLDVDGLYSLWSEADSLEIREEDDTEALIIEQNYENGVALREESTFHPHEKMAFRAGYSFDDTVMPTAVLGASFTDARRHAGTVGFTYAYEAWRLDFFQMLGAYEQRDVRDSEEGFDGNHDRTEWSSGVSVGVRVW